MKKMNITKVREKEINKLSTNFRETNFSNIIFYCPYALKKIIISIYLQLKV